MSDTTFGPADDYAERMLERRKASQELVHALFKDNPMEGKTPEEMHAINTRGLALQDGLRGAMMVGLSFNVDPVGCFNAALEALITVFSSMEQTDQTRETVGYLLTIARGVKEAHEGPLSILRGELYLKAVVDTRKEISKTVREHLGLPMKGEVKGGTHIETKMVGEDNTVIDAAHLFRRNDGGETVH